MLDRRLRINQILRVKENLARSISIYNYLNSLNNKKSSSTPVYTLYHQIFNVFIIKRKKVQNERNGLELYIEFSFPLHPKIQLEPDPTAVRTSHPLLVVARCNCYMRARKVQHAAIGEARARTLLLSLSLCTLFVVIVVVVVRGEKREKTQRESEASQERFELPRGGSTDNNVPVGHFYFPDIYWR